MKSNDFQPESFLQEPLDIDAPTAHTLGSFGKRAGSNSLQFKEAEFSNF
jgi:hypothetical protein